MEVSQGLLGGFDVEDNRPTAGKGNLFCEKHYVISILIYFSTIQWIFSFYEGVNGSLMVTVTGSDSATVTEVILVDSSGAGQVNGTVEAQGGGDFLAQFDRIPSEEFVVLVKGQNSNVSTREATVFFQRQSLTNIRASTLTVTVVSKMNPFKNMRWLLT